VRVQVFKEFDDTIFSYIYVVHTLYGAPDQIPTRLLKLCASKLSHAIVRIFQTSLDSGTVPSDWKEALITPLVKKGERNVASNYRC
jgi:hypothetical protein